MADQMKKTGVHTSDRKDVGTSVQHHRSHGAVNGAAGGSKTLHPGQPVNMAGGGLKTGHTATNC